jgi:Leucine-rich repeat (LRR) protein
VKKLLLLILVLFYFQVNSQSLETDRAALIKFYNATNGSQWNNNTNWNSTISPCGWYGVICEGDRVANLNLFSNNLSGTIPPEIQNLPELNTLVLSNNKISGSIPEEIFNLSKLQYVSLEFNNLTGNISAELSKLQKLRELYISNNQLYGDIPGELLGMPSLTILNLQQNLLTGSISPDIGKAVSMQTLNLQSNQLSGDLPEEIGNLSDARAFFLQHNNFSGNIPSSIGKLSKLGQLNLSFNQFTGSLPPEFESLSQLFILNLSNNQLTGGVWPVLERLTALEELNITGNTLGGTIPGFLGNLRNLFRLHLGYIGVSGQIPVELGDISRLSQLHLFGNNLTGSIPNTIADLQRLNWLDISGNHLSGTIPDFPYMPVNGIFNIYWNKFSFNGMESNKTKLDIYAPQEALPFTVTGRTLSVDAGGTLSNNVYRWYKNNILVASNRGVNSFTVSDNGDYRVEIENDLLPGLTLFTDPYTFSANPLPVMLASFSAKKVEQGNLILWSTTMEINNAAFELERSCDAKNFETIAKRDGKGNSKFPVNYQFTDTIPLEENYYRLKQIDYDRTSTYSRIIHVQSVKSTLKVYPNPTHGDFILESSAIHEPATIYNLLGQKLLEKQGSKLHTFKTDAMNNGIYIIKVGNQSVKLVLEK